MEGADEEGRAECGGRAASGGQRRRGVLLEELTSHLHAACLTSKKVAERVRYLVPKLGTVATYVYLIGSRVVLGIIATCVCLISSRVTRYHTYICLPNGCCRVGA